MSNISIGITICLREENESVWTNGIKQNAIFLAKTFMNSDKNYNVYIVNTSDVKITDKLGWDIEKYKTVQLNDIKDELDIIFPLGGALDGNWTKYFRDKGCKVVPYKCGNEYIISMENIMFNARESKPNYHQVDQVWNIPQMENTNQEYWRMLYRAEAITIPFVWNEMFLETHVEELKKIGINPYYEPSNEPKEISVFEPNINVYKFAMYPLLITEDVYRERPELIKKVKITNTQRIRFHQEFIHLVKQLDIENAGKVTYEDRFPMAWFLAKHTDIVLSHQWENALNYAYIDAVYLGYPIVHNAHYFKEAGYYYDQFNIKQGKEQLIYAMTEHDNNIKEYNEKSKKIIHKYHSDNPDNVKRYDELIENLLKTNK